MEKKMGDRGCVFVVQGKDENGDYKGVFLYTHWRGYRLEEIVRAAIRRGRDRWGDDTYLTRIIFCEMVKGEEMNTTGFGISVNLTESEYPYIRVYPEEERIEMVDKKLDPRHAPALSSRSFLAFERGE
jgi:hypothetical protein